jgi:UDP-2,3-diacylglucosamine hydrolase
LTQVLPDRELAAGPLLVWTDLHLQADAPEEIRSFAAQLDAIPSGQTLLILGDLFDAWTGPESVAGPEFAPLRAALAARQAAGQPSFLLRGNRDVLMQPCQAERLGLELADRLIWQSPGGKVLFSHGDEYCLNDLPYQRLRRTLRRPVVRGMLRCLPAALRIWMGRKMRGHSQQAVARKPLDSLALELPAAQAALDRASANYAVIGHLHAPAVHALDAGKQLIVLPAWQPSQPAWTSPEA